MKLRIWTALVIAGALLYTGCNKCDNTENVKLDATKQYASIKFYNRLGESLIDSVWNLSNVNVSFYKSYQDLVSPVGSHLISEDLSDKTMGPFQYTTNPISPKTGVLYDLYYVMNLDTSGVDTFRVRYLYTTDECRTYFQEIKYYYNGTELTDQLNKEAAEVSVTLPYRP